MPSSPSFRFPSFSISSAPPSFPRNCNDEDIRRLPETCAVCCWHLSILCTLNILQAISLPEMRATISRCCPASLISLASPCRSLKLFNAFLCATTHVHVPGLVLCMVRLLVYRFLRQKPEPLRMCIGLQGGSFYDAKIKVLGPEARRNCDRFFFHVFSHFPNVVQAVRRIVAQF